MKQSKIATDKTFWVASSASLLRKLAWEIELRKQFVHTSEAAFVDFNIAWTAFHALDWIAWELSDLQLWPEVVAEFQLPIGPDAKQYAKLKALRDFARSTCKAMEYLEQTALAAKHRNLRDYDEKLATTWHMVSMTSTTVGEQSVPAAAPRKATKTVSINGFYRRKVHRDSQGFELSKNDAPYDVAHEALSWLTSFTERFQLEQKFRRHIIDAGVQASKEATPTW